MMRIITLEEPVALAHPVVTVGTFDGIHIGHVSVIEAMIDMARTCRGTSVVVTFDPHPRQFIDGADAPGVLTSLEEKKHCLASLGVDVLAVVGFDDALRQMSPEVFVKCFLVDKLSARSVIIGYDHGFGRGRQGGFGTMKRLGKQFGFSVFSPPAVCIAEKPVSSTRIRNALLGGDMDAVIQLMGHPYPLWGRVVEGEKRGRALGFPTANLLFETPGKLLPTPGFMLVLPGWISPTSPLSITANVQHLGGSQRVVKYICSIFHKISMGKFYPLRFGVAFAASVNLAAKKR